MKMPYERLKPKIDLLAPDRIESWSRIAWLKVAIRQRLQTTFLGMPPLPQATNQPPPAPQQVQRPLRGLPEVNRRKTMFRPDMTWTVS